MGKVFISVMRKEPSGTDNPLIVDFTLLIPMATSMQCGRTQMQFNSLNSDWLRRLTHRPLIEALEKPECQDIQCNF
jgi:hypothetical protein